MVQQPISPIESNASAKQPAKVHLPRTSESEQLKKIRHTASHVMAMAVKKLFPKAQVTMDTGLSMDFTTTSTTQSLSRKRI